MGKRRRSAYRKRPLKQFVMLLTLIALGKCCETESLVVSETAIFRQLVDSFRGDVGFVVDIMRNGQSSFRNFVRGDVKANGPSAVGFAV